MDVFSRMTPAARRSIQLAMREALQLGHNYVGTEHLLLGIIREDTSLGPQILSELGVTDINSVRRLVIDDLSANRLLEHAEEVERQDDIRTLLVSLSNKVDDLTRRLDEKEQAE